MKALDLLTKVVENGSKLVGIAVSGLFETPAEFCERWFGGGLLTGYYERNKRFLYIWGERVDERTPDAIISGFDRDIYLYRIDAEYSE